MSCNCEHCNGELTDEECLTKRLETAEEKLDKLKKKSSAQSRRHISRIKKAEATIKTQKAAIDAVRGLHSHQPPLAPDGHMCVWLEDIQAALNKAENGT